MNLDEMITYARGEKQADLLLTNARVVNVFSGKIIPRSIGVANGYITGFGSYPAKKTIDMNGRFVAPGFIDAHVHIESSMSCPTEFVRCVLPHGTTTVAADPHEIANVFGAEGIDYMIDSSKDQPMNIFFTLPSCVPATEMETSGAKLDADDLLPFFGHERIIALAEMMNFPGVIYRNKQVLKKIERMKKQSKPVDGHAPGLTGRDLYAYISAGISSDHECTTIKEAEEKLNAGMHIMIREGTGAKNLKALLPLVNRHTARRVMWCTDDRHPHDIIKEGHIDFIVRSAIKMGLDPVTAIKIATINPAEYFGLNHVGAIAPGRQADMVVFSHINHPVIEEVYVRGKLTARKGKMLPGIKKPTPLDIRSSMNVDMAKIDFSIPAVNRQARVIEIIPDQLATGQSLSKMPVSGSTAVCDIKRDILKIAVVERHRKTGNIAVGFVRGFGLKQGALASSVAHDSHNIIVTGTNDEDMRTALEAVVRMGGGLVAAYNGKICADLHLPIAGLMSMQPVETIKQKLDHLIEISRKFGSSLNDPFMTLSFLALPVIPELKITDKGLVDVTKFRIVPLFVNE
ncbi:MAG: adenine deaminase [Thermodesulfobacteriota bacterium]|nr:adenine deaminase [Thermodesulfobacteriota bacterium]